MRIVRPLLIAGVALGASQSSQTTGLVVGTVTDATRHTPIADVDVRLGDTRVGARTDSLGRYRLVNVPRGRHPLLVHRLGYTDDSTDVVVGADSVVLDVALTEQARQLATTRVKGKRTPTTTEIPNVSPQLQEFEQRRIMHSPGYYVTGEELDRNPDRKLGDVLSNRMPGIRILRAPDGSQYAASSRTVMKLGPIQQKGADATASPTQCVPKVFLNGMPLGDSTLTNFAATELGGVEYHDVTSMPVQYRRPGTECGVLLLWSR